MDTKIYYADKDRPIEAEAHWCAECGAEIHPLIEEVLDEDSVCANCLDRGKKDGHENIVARCH